MRLVVVSHTAHYLRNGQIVGWGPTVREIDGLATLFREVVHVAPLHAGGSPTGAIPYASSRVRLVPLRPAGGDRWREKLALLSAAPGYLQVLLREVPRSDVVHVRCPAAVSLLAVILLIGLRRPRKRWIKYAGSWAGGAREPWSYALQRWLLAGKAHRALVTVNGRWAGQPAHVRSFLNPCLTDEELAEGKRAAAGKLLTSPVRLLFVGRLAEGKGAGRVVDILELLARKGVPVEADLVGEGPLRRELEARVGNLIGRVEARVHGSLPRSRIASLYEDAHLLLLPSATEGWPKVLSEGMAYGVVPVASDVGSIPDTLRELGTGRSFDPLDVSSFAEAVAEYLQRPETWREESRRAVAAAADFSYSRYLAEVAGLLKLADEEEQSG